jgi:hypothetical protein
MLAALIGAGSTLAVELLLLVVGAVIGFRVWRRIVGGPALPRKVSRMLGINLTSLVLKLLGGLAVVIAIYLIGHSAGVGAEQKREDKAVSPICEAVGSTWVEVDANGKPISRSKWGGACLKAAQDLAKFKGDALSASNKALSDHAAEEAEKTAADAAAATRHAQTAAAAKQNMEKLDAQVRDNRVDGGWFAGLNELGGLRQPPKAGPGRAVSKPGH